MLGIRLNASELSWIYMALQHYEISEELAPSEKTIVHELMREFEVLESLSVKALEGFLQL